VVNFSLVRQTLLNQALIGFTIWTGGYGAQVLVENAQFDTNALAFGIAGVVPLIIFSRFIERSEAPAVADLNLSTNMLVLRLFGDKPQPVVAFVVSALLAAVTGLVEETTFRGQVLPALAEKLDSLPASIVLSTLLFAVLHINPIALFRGGGEGAKDAAVLVAYQIVTGSVFAALLLLTDNLAVPIIAHALFDCYVFFATHLQVTSQMQYARSEALMPVAPAGVEAKWRQRRGDGFLLVARESFYLADSNRDGVLSRPELRIALYSYGIRLTAEESAAVTRAADRDRSGAIDFGEFLEYVGPSGSPGNAIKNSLLGVNG
jgi:membrane protease YdiL (CAAX protease family)